MPRQHHVAVHPRAQHGRRHVVRVGEAPAGGADDRADADVPLPYIIYH